MAKTGSLSCRVDARVKAAAARAARDDHRSLASLVEKLLAAYLVETGYLPETKNSVATGTPRGEAGPVHRQSTVIARPAAPAATIGPARWRSPQPGRADVPSWPDR